MSGQGGRGASGTGPEATDSGSTLVCGTSGHDAACRQLVADTPVCATRICVTGSEDAPEPCAASDEVYQTAVYEGLGLPESGIVVSDTLETLPAERGRDDSPPFVICVDAVPHPDDKEGRDRLFRFLHALTRRVRNADGSCHVHLDADRSAPLATVLAPLFDDVLTAETATPSTA